MSGNGLIADTNIILYILGGNEKLAKKTDKKNIYISFITELELLSYGKFENKEIKENTIKIRKKYSVKLPDAIIAATSKYLDLPLITADKDFKKIKDINLVSFKI
ncbi:MAG: type II toxin-antitoxin system VapC family toxin [Chlorobi bacterium]|nr:type II toxin-antitoxin system VapC family toxin [Chlorobiota bacterium]